MDVRSPPEYPTEPTFMSLGKIRGAKDCSMPARSLGRYVSFDDGAHWQPLQLNLPPIARFTTSW